MVNEVLTQQKEGFYLILIERERSIVSWGETI
jgi:hypothetical protein